MKEITLDVLFGWLIMNIQNHEVVNIIVESLQSSDPSIDMTGFINLYTQYLISPELITVERLVVELMKIYDREDPDYEPGDESDGSDDPSSDEESDLEEIDVAIE